ncbi:MAG: response regulator transcription factor [Verrucomicrobiota bacterium]
MPAKPTNSSDALAPPGKATAASKAPAARVAVVEDDLNLRKTMIAFINRSPGFCCAGTFADGEAALAEIPALKPDVVLMDIGLPGMSGIECVSALKSLMPTTPIIMLTVYDEGDYLFDSLKAGASGYLLKRAIGDKLLEAMEEARAGGLPLTRHMAAKVGQYFQKFGKSQTEVNALTPREQEVLQLLAEGFRYKEMAAQMGISLDTVREHVRRIYTKLHVSSRTEAVVKYLGGSNKSIGEGHIHQ